jgi:hypothetical protein
MTLVEAIASIQALDLPEDEKRQRVYALKADVLCSVIRLNDTIQHGDFHYRINQAEVTPQQRLALDVTFWRDDKEVTHQIIITNPPVLPRERTGNEKEDLKTAISEMLEGFV